MVGTGSENSDSVKRKFRGDLKYSRMNRNSVSWETKFRIVMGRPLIQKIATDDPNER